MYKQHQTEALIKTRDELIKRIEGLPIFRSDQSIAKVQITFAVDDVIEKLTGTQLVSEQPIPVLAEEKLRLAIAAEKAEQKHQESLAEEAYEQDEIEETESVEEEV